MKQEIVYVRKWCPAIEIKEEHKNFPIRQVTCFIITKDEKLLLVSKDGNSWSVVAGHYEFKKDSSYIDTAVREVYEESGLDISSSVDRIVRLGYYVIKDVERDSGKIVDIYLQVRTFLPLDINSEEIVLRPTELDLVKYADFFTFEDSKKLIKWLKDSGEWEAIKDIRNYHS